MRLSNNLLRVHVAGFEQAIVALRGTNGQGRLHEEIAELFAQNANAAGDDNLALAVRAAMQQIAAAVPDLPAQQASKYQNWLLTRYRQNWATQTEANAPQPLLLEDLSKYVEDLTLYHNTPNVIKKRAGISPDLFAIESPFKLAKLLRAVRGELATEFKPLSPTQQGFIDSEQAIVIGQTAQWRLVMPLTKEASQEFGAGTRWCTAAQQNNLFNGYFPNSALLYLEASGIGKIAFLLKDGKIDSMFDAEDTEQTPAQQQALFNKLPTLAAQLQQLEAAVPLLRPAIDKGDFDKAFELSVASRNLAPDTIINEAMLIERMSAAHLTPHEQNNTLLAAAKGGLLKTTEALLKLGANVDIYDNTALRHTATFGHINVMKLLLEHGANVHADNDFALRRAACDGRADMVKLLLEHGANVHAVNDAIKGWVANNGHTEVFKMLETYIAKAAVAQRPSPQKPESKLNNKAFALTGQA